MSSNFALGLSYIRYTYGSDETRERYSNDNDSRISIGGLDFDDFYYLDSVVRIDGKYQINSKAFVVAGVSYEQAYYYTGEDEDEINSGEKTADLGFSLSGQYNFNNIFVEAFLNYKSISNSNGFEDPDAKKGYSEVNSISTKTQRIRFEHWSAVLKPFLCS